MKKTIRTLPALVLLLALSLGAKGVASETITVSAAASLIDAFQTIALEFKARHPDDNVRLNFASSGTLLQQINYGAPVDVLATADEHTMDLADAKGLIFPESRRIFAQNSLVLIQPLDASTSIGSLATLRSADVRRIAIGNPDGVPAGRYARLALESAGLWEPLQSKIVLTQNVRQALDYVARGEVDAGFVYGSDATAMRHKVRTTTRVSLSSPISFPIARVAHGRESARTAAEHFIELVLSPYGKKVLAGCGFDVATQ